MGIGYRHFAVLLAVVSMMGIASSGETFLFHQQYYVMYCTVTATLHGVRIRLDEPHKLSSVAENMTDCGRLMSSERNSGQNISGRLLVLRKKSDPTAYLDLCSRDDMQVLQTTNTVRSGDEPTIIVTSRTNLPCDLNARYRSAVGLRGDKVRNLKGMFVVVQSEQYRSRIMSDSPMSNEMNDQAISSDFPIIQSDSQHSGLMNLLKNAEESARSYIRNRSQFSDEELYAALEMTVWIVYGKPVPPANYFGSPLSISKTSILFVAVSFMTLMLVSLAWLLVYYVQRFRYVHAKDRLARRLANAARKALARIPTRTLHVGDVELASDETVCAICIEPYALEQLVRTLPCRHTFHRSCVDTWLLEQRSCPVCKLDILKAFGTLRTASAGSSAEPADAHSPPAAPQHSAEPGNSRLPPSNVHVVLTHAEIVPHADEALVSQTDDVDRPREPNSESDVNVNVNVNVAVNDVDQSATYSKRDEEPNEDASLMDNRQTV